ncbi:MAG: hypothetical protein GTO30_20860, partial [Acidobacteria bacterium]|nr:hypothetical protein [Acidobacteriota bacterium]NIQ87021.1 hypothetical protein [Acidobacteriota bacterium]
MTQQFDNLVVGQISDVRPIVLAVRQFGRHLGKILDAQNEFAGHSFFQDEGLRLASVGHAVIDAVQAAAETRLDLLVARRGVRHHEHTGSENFQGAPEAFALD